LSEEEPELLEAAFFLALVAFLTSGEDSQELPDSSLLLPAFFFLGELSSDPEEEL
jgi:hypothetical protein